MNTRIRHKKAQEIYEEHGEVGFWFFYKDAVTSHLENIKANSYDGPKYIYKGFGMLSMGVLMILLLVIARILFPITKIKLARKASKDYQAWIEEKK
ncbi:hypothetical protein OSG_eHP35_00035 [environmental Halophage eHP-35]|nr:hypothetical protein OSG_eHP35_00035 [environmental Halophage eHP-35]